MPRFRTARGAAVIALLGASACAPAAPAPAPPAPPLAAPAPPSALPVPPATSVRLGDEVLPRAYDLHLRIDPSKPRFSGDLRLSLDVRTPTTTFVLHGRDLAIHGASIELASGQVVPVEITPRAAFGAREAIGELVVRAASPLPAGAATLVIAWDAPFATLWGLYRTRVGDDDLAFSQMEPIDARRAFPCFDEPRFKAPFTTRVTAPRGISVHTNGRPVRVEERGDEVTHHFAATPPIPAYLTAFAVGRLEREAGASPDVGVVAAVGRAREGREAVEATERMLRAQADYFAIPYPYGKLDVVAVPDFGPGAMENPGLVTFREEFLLLGAEPPAEVRRRMRGIVSHELAHQWFGNLVTMQWWEDLWLNEAFATWMGPRTVAEVFPESRALDDRVLWEARAVDGDVLPSARAVRPRIDTEDAIHEAGGWSAYLKGSTVLAMIEGWVGPERFQRALRAYMQKHAHGGAALSDLARELDLAAPAERPSEVLQSFVEQPGVPLVHVDVRCGEGKGPSPRASLSFRVEPLRVDDAAFAGVPTPSWTVPVCARVEGERAPRCQRIEPRAPRELALDRCPAFVYPDAGETGYFRFRLDDAWWGRLLQHAGELTATERAGLVLGAWSLAQTGHHGVDRVVAALRALRLRKDEPRVVVEAVVTVLRDLERTLVDDRSRPDFQRLVADVLGGVAIPSPRPPWTTAADEQRLLRVALLGALADLAPSPGVDAALAKAKAGPPDEDLAALSLRLEARRGGPIVAALTSEQAFAAATQGLPPYQRVALTHALGSIGDEARLAQALEVVLSPAFRAGDFRNVRWSAQRSAEGRRGLTRFMTLRFDALVKKLGGAGSLTASIAGACDAAELARLEAFFGPKMQGLEGAQRGFDEGRAEARRCIALRDRLAPELRAVLAKR